MVIFWWLCLNKACSVFYISCFSFFQYAIQRAKFDECISQTHGGGAQHGLDSAGLCLLSRQLIFFYRQNIDAHRLVRITNAFQVMHWWFQRCYYNQMMYVEKASVCSKIIYVSVLTKIWLCQNLVKHNSQFVKLLVSPQKQTCVFQIKRILGFCCRYSIPKRSNKQIKYPISFLGVYIEETEVDVR